MCELQDTGSVFEQPPLWLHDTLFQPEQLRSELLALAFTCLSFSLRLTYLLLACARAIAAKATALAARVGTSGAVELRHGDGGIAILGLNGKILADRVDALLDVLRLFLEVVDLFLGEDGILLAVGQGCLCKKVDLDWVFEVDKNGALWALRVELRKTVSVACQASGMREVGSTTNRIESWTFLLEAIQDVLAIAVHGRLPICRRR